MFGVPHLAADASLAINRNTCFFRRCVPSLTHVLPSYHKTVENFGYVSLFDNCFLYCVPMTCICLSLADVVIM